MWFFICHATSWYQGWDENIWLCIPSQKCHPISLTMESKPKPRVIILSQDILIPFSQLCLEGNKTFPLYFFPVLLQQALPHNFSWLHLFLTTSLSNCAEIWKWLLNTHQRIKTKLNLNGLYYSPWKRDSWQSYPAPRHPLRLHKECHPAPLVAPRLQWQTPTFQAIGSNQFSIHSKRCLAWFPSNRLMNMAILRSTWTELIQMIRLKKNTYQYHHSFFILCSFK